ncbi:MAG: hypothetical protein HZB23_06505 [Deltaproteobacteria bacterium]|nr:hypothetical protein [Deltaproteobacteria bacterium]
MKRLIRVFIASICLIISMCFLVSGTYNPKNASNKPGSENHPEYYFDDLGHKDFKAFDGEFDNVKALTFLFGKLRLFVDADGRESALCNNMKYFEGDEDNNWPFDENGIIHVLHDSQFKQNDIEKHLIFFTINPVRDFCDSHNCSPWIGLAIFVHKNDIWIIESWNRYLGGMGIIGVPSEYKISLIPISKNKFGILYSTVTFSQGNKYVETNLYVPYKNYIISSLYFYVVASGCDYNKQASKLTVDVKSIINNSISDYYVLEATITHYYEYIYSENTSDDGKPSKLTKRYYKFSNWKYKETESVQSAARRPKS